MISRKKIVFIGSLMLFFWQFMAEIKAQEILHQNVEFINSGEEKVGDALREISEKHGFYFSYQDSIIQVEKAVSMDHYKGTIEVFLEKLLEVILIFLKKISKMYCPLG